MLAGVAVSSLATAVQTFMLQRNAEVVREVYSWILGRLSTARWADVRLVLPYVVVSCDRAAAAPPPARPVPRRATTRRRRSASPVARVRLVVVVAATLGTAAVVSVSGLIGFVGIVVPHVVRLVAGSSYRRLLPLSLLLGAAFLILADIPGRVLTDPAETPIGVVTAFLGAPFFIVVLRARRRRDELAGAARAEPCATGERSRLAPFTDTVRLGGVARAHRAQRRRQVVAAAGRRRARASDGRASSSTARRCRCAPADGGPSSSPTCRSRR